MAPSTLTEQYWMNVQLRYREPVLPGRHRVRGLAIGDGEVGDELTPSVGGYPEPLKRQQG